jgi:hypothetical protein
MVCVGTTWLVCDESERAPFLPYNMYVTSTVWYIHFWIATSVGLCCRPNWWNLKMGKWSTPLFNLSLECNFHPKKIELCNFIQISMTKKITQNSISITHLTKVFFKKIKFPSFKPNSLRAFQQKPRMCLTFTSKFLKKNKKSFFIFLNLQWKYLLFYIWWLLHHRSKHYEITPITPLLL